MALWFATFFGLMMHQHGNDNAPPPALFIMVPLIWLGFMSMWGAVLVIAIVYAIKAGRGEWANYPVIGRIARRILKMNVPDSTAIPSTDQPGG
jgi:uncharacterized membrane protein